MIRISKAAYHPYITISSLLFWVKAHSGGHVSIEKTTSPVSRLKRSSSSLQAWSFVHSALDIWAPIPVRAKGRSLLLGLRWTGDKASLKAGEEFPSLEWKETQLSPVLNKPVLSFHGTSSVITLLRFHVSVHICSWTFSCLKVNKMSSAAFF